MDRVDTALKVDQMDLLNKLQRILGEGVFVATYKYALILTLAEPSVEKTAAPDGSLSIPLNELSERFMILYWHQTAPFAAGAVIQQSTGEQASAINLIARFRERAPTLATAQRHNHWPVLVRNVAKVLVDMPLWKLQRVGPDHLNFLYEERLIDEAIRLRPGIAAFFQQQISIVRALVQMAWLTFVQKLPSNRDLLGSTGDLADFLFGTERSSLRALIEGLTSLQLNRCFIARVLLQGRSRSTISYQGRGIPAILATILYWRIEHVIRAKRRCSPLCAIFDAGLIETALVR